MLNTNNLLILFNQHLGRQWQSPLCSVGLCQDLLGEDTTPNELTMEKLFRKPARLGARNSAIP